MDGFLEICHLQCVWINFVETFRMLPTWIDWLVKDYGCPMKASPKHTPNVLSQNWHLATAKLLGFIDINSPWHRDYAHPALMSTPRIESNRRAWWYGNGLLNLVVLSLLKSDGIALKQLEAGKYHFCSVKALKKWLLLLSLAKPSN